MDSAGAQVIRWRAVTAGLFLPLLYWAGAVTAISYLGYPGVVCTTPAAWLLALPVGMRTARECGLKCPEKTALRSAAVGGGLLGLVQALIMAGILTVAPVLPGGVAAAGANEIINPLVAALIVAVAGVPVTAGLAVLAARTTRRKI